MNDTANTASIATSLFVSSDISKFCNYITDISLLMISVSSLGCGIFQYTIEDAFAGVGYLSSGIFAATTLFTIRKMRLKASLQSSVNVLKDENEELKESNDKLTNNLYELNSLKEDLNKDLTLLKNVTGIIGENADDLMDNLREIHDKLEIENNRHTLLINSQAKLHLINLFNHFDKDNNLVLDPLELNLAREHIKQILPPTIQWADVENNIQNKSLKLKNILKLLK
tara:strand:+ start:732 stop:1412 length:681 start_codon:yes stop_codon:yes gene_type:complete